MRNEVQHLKTAFVLEEPEPVAPSVGFLYTSRRQRQEYILPFQSVSPEPSLD
jgi:hypothetical protein